MVCIIIIYNSDSEEDCEHEYDVVSSGYYICKKCGYTTELWR